MAFTYTPYQKKQYQQSDTVNKAQGALQQHQQNKPGQYQSQWQQNMDELLSKIKSREPFKYDVNADAMYQQMLDQYIQQGKNAMMDTMGQASTLTGGYGNSYAQTAGQQVYQGYLQGAGEMLPQYYNMALDRYKMEGDDLLRQYGMLADREEADYRRYEDTLNRYYTELNQLQGVYDSERDYDYGRFQNDQAFDYGMYMDDQNRQYQADRDAVADAQWDKQWAYQLERDKQEDALYDRQLAQAQVDQLLSAGADIPESLIAASGYDPGYISAIRAAKTAVPSGSGGRKASSEKDDKKSGSDYYVTHEQMVKEVNQFKKDAMQAGLPAAEAQKQANLLAGTWYQQHGKWA